MEKLEKRPTNLDSENTELPVSERSIDDRDPEKVLERDFAPIVSRKNSAARNALNKTPTAQDWTGPDDPENPHNWPMWKRAYTTSIPGLLCFTVTFGSSIYTPGVPNVEKQFHVSNTAALLPLSLYVLGLGLGPAIAAPLSETYGRRSVYLFATPLSMFFILGAGLSQNFATLLIMRFLAGVLGSPCLAVGAGSNSDIWPHIDRAAATSTFLLAPFLGPALGPTVGGFAAQAKGWRWTQWPILFIGLAVWLYSIPQKETYKKVILQHRAKRLGIPPPPKTTPPGLAGIKFLLVVTLIRPIRMLFTEPIVGFYSLYSSFNFAVLFCFFAAFPIVFEGVYGFNRGETGLSFLGIGTGCVLAVVTFITTDRLTYRKRTLQHDAAGNTGPLAPEYRLYPAMIGSVMLPIGLFWFAWTARRSIHWIVPIIATIPFACGNLLVFCSAALYLIDTYGQMNGASAMAANGLLRYVFGAAFPLFTVQMYIKLGIDWATSLLGFIAICLMPVPWVLFKFGKQIRSKSAYETFKD